MSFRKLRHKILGKAAQPSTLTSADQAESSRPSSVRSPSPAPFPDGIDVLHPCADATVDICFVHGLTGDRARTWTAEGQAEPWPKTLLPPLLARARILTYGYDAYVLRKSVAATDRLIDHATNLLNDLTTDRAGNNAVERPIIFVAHSLGGLVCKEALLLSRNNPEPHLKSVFNSTKAIVFMGTPHTGSWMADWAKIPAAGLGIVKSTNKSLLKVLETDDQLLESIQIGFLSMIRDLRESDRQLYVTCFFEALPLPVAGVIVSKDSATFPGYNSISIRANHRDMVRFASAEDTGFKRLLGELTRWEAEISVKSTAIEPVEQPTTGPVAFEAEAVLDSSSESEATGPSGPDDYLSTALYLFNIHCNEESQKERAHAAISKYLEMTDQEDVLREITRLRLKKLSAQRDKRKALEKQAKKAYYGTTSRCLKTLSFPEMGVREANIERPTGDTCTWIYANPIYKSWEEDSNTLLWIKGKPGSGKSTLMKSLFLYRKGPIPNPAVTYLSFFFNARGSAVEKTPVGLYITLLHNLLRELPLAMCEFLPLFLEKELHSQNGKVSWQVSEVATFFHASIGQRQPRQLEIMVDALDECEEEEVRQVIRKFESSIADAKTSEAELRVCWSSRYYPNISLQSEHGLEFQLDKQNNADIREYVETELPDRKDPSFPSIREELISRANGVFLWAVLVSKRLIKGVDQGKDEAQLKELFNSIPAKLDDLFDEIFSNTDVRVDERRDLTRIAQWIFCAFRPLTPTEFLTALSFQASNTPIAIGDMNFSYDTYSRLTRRIVDLSGGLFEVVESAAFGSRVQVIHESVREFFLGPKGLQLLQVSSRELFMTLGHKALALGCFQALLAKEFDSALKRPKIKDSSSITDVWKYLSVAWQPPENTFLTNYVQDFVFEHFDLAKDQFQSEHDPKSPFESLKVRRRAFENFLRLCCSQITENQTLRPGFSAHMQKLSAEAAAAFGLTDAELSGLLTFLNNLSCCSLFFTARHIFMYDPVLARAVPKEETFLALFYLYPRSEDTNIPLTAFFTPPTDTQDDEPCTSNINFCFGMTFKTSGRSEPAQVLTQMRSWKLVGRRPDSAPASLPMVLQDWKFAEDIDEFAEFRAYKSVLRNFPKAKLHEYSKPTTLCLFLRRPGEDFARFAGLGDAEATAGSASKSGLDDDGEDGPAEPPPRHGSRSHIDKSGWVLGYGRGSLPMGSWWRLRHAGRDRDIFEADTDDESEEEDEDEDGVSDSASSGRIQRATPPDHGSESESSWESEDFSRYPLSEPGSLHSDTPSETDMSQGLLEVDLEDNLVREMIPW